MGQAVMQVAQVIFNYYIHKNSWLITGVKYSILNYVVFFIKTKKLSEKTYFYQVLSKISSQKKLNMREGGKKAEHQFLLFHHKENISREDMSSPVKHKVHQIVLKTSICHAVI